MNLAYGIISINDVRAENKQAIRSALSYPEMPIRAVDGSDVSQMAAAWKEHPNVKRTARLRVGEMGIWLSLLNTWKDFLETDYDGLIVLEDDAIPQEDVENTINWYVSYLPETFDLLSLWVPDNQRRDFYTNYAYDENGIPHTIPVGVDTRDGAPCFKIEGSILARAYQGYGGVALLFSRRGAEKFYKLAELQGMFSTSDCSLFINAHRGIISAYAPRPDAKTAFGYNWKAATNIHNTPYIGKD